MSKPPPYDPYVDPPAGPPPYTPPEPVRAPAGFSMPPGASYNGNTYLGGTQYPGSTYPAPHQQMYVQQQGSVHVVTTQPATRNVVVVGQGNCPVCRAGYLTNSFTCLGICCCIFFFPFGFICLFALMQRRCTNCGMTFG